MGDLSASDSPWNKMVIAKSNNKWVSKVQDSLESEMSEHLVMNDSYTSNQIIKQEMGDSHENNPRTDSESDDDEPDNEHLIERKEGLVKKCKPKVISCLSSVESSSKRKQRKTSISKTKTETPEERATRLSKMSAYAARRLANETPEQRSLRLKRMSEYAAKRLSRESPTERALRLSRMSTYAAQRLANETPEQRNARLSRMSAYAARRHAMRKGMVTPETELHNSKDFVSDQS